jgi:hypothetical protein
MFLQVATDSFNVAQEIAYSEFLRSEPFRRTSKSSSRIRLRSPTAFAPSLGAQLAGGKRTAMEEWTTECSTYKRSRSHHAKSPRQSPAPMSP